MSCFTSKPCLASLTCLLVSFLASSCLASSCLASSYLVLPCHAFVVLSWDRRSRVPLDDLVSLVVPLPEVAESYRVEIYNSSGDLVRTETVSTDSYTYTAANQAADGTTAGGFDAKVAQIDPVSGDGRTTTLAVAP